MSVPAESPILSLQKISKSFSGVEVLHSIDLDLYPGRVLALLGENGAGKSTLMNIASGSLRPDGGRLVWQGSEIMLSSTGAALRLGISHIHQELSCIGALTVMENLFLDDYRSNRWGLINRQRMAADARQLLARVGGEHISPETIVAELSTADQQIVEIAKALSRDVRLLIMDEPTSSLTPHEVKTLFRIVRELRAGGVSIVFISHRLEETLNIADRAAVLRDGSLVSDRPIAATSIQTLIADMAGRAFSFSERRPVQPAKDAPALLSVESLIDAAGFGPFSFQLRAGEVLGVFGLVSSGRSELLEMLCGLRRPISGGIRLFDGEARPSGPVDAWRRGIAFLPEGRARNGIFPQLSVRENIAIGVRNASRSTLVDSPPERKRIDQLYERLSIRARDKGQEMLYLSGGNQQKAILARCLAVGPKVLLLDEPTHGVDVRTKAELYRIIDELSQQGLGIIFVSSEIPEIRAIASTILILAGGKQVFLQKNEGLDDHTLLEAAFLELSTPSGLRQRNP